MRGGGGHKLAALGQVPLPGIGAEGRRRGPGSNQPVSEVKK
jgi:hypothetical protein